MTELFDGGAHSNDRRRALVAKQPGSVEQTQNHLLQLFPPNIARELQLHAKRRRVRTGEIFHDVGDPIAEVCFPVNAAFALQAVLRDGHSIDVALAGRDGAVGMAVGVGCEIAVSRAVCQIGGEADFIPAARFITIVSRDAAACALIARYGDVLRLQSQQQACCCSRHDIKARFASWLLACRDCTGQDDLRITQDLAGQSLAVRRTSVTMAAIALQEAAIIRYRRGLLQVLDLPALRKASCECYATTRAQTELVLSPSL